MQSKKKVREGLHRKNLEVLFSYRQVRLFPKSAQTILLDVFFLTLVLLTISLFSPFSTQVTITGTSSDLSRKVWVTAYKGDAY